MCNFHIEEHQNAPAYTAGSEFNSMRSMATYLGKFPIPGLFNKQWLSNSKFSFPVLIRNYITICKQNPAVREEWGSVGQADGWAWSWRSFPTRWFYGQTWETGHEPHRYVCPLEKGRTSLYRPTQKAAASSSLSHRCGKGTAKEKGDTKKGLSSVPKVLVILWSSWMQNK